MSHPSPGDDSCRICMAHGAVCGTRLVLGKHVATYRRCGECGYVWVEAPHWLEEAYSHAIAALDTGIVVRNLWLADACCALLGTSLRGVQRLLDFGGGTGLLVRMLRDRGHDARWLDAYCENQLAPGFEARAGDTYDLVTAFELVEHLPDPMPVFRRLHALAPRILIATELQPEDPACLMDWWYLAPEAGQHIGFFTRRSLERVAEQLGLVLSSNGRNLHILAPAAVSETWLGMLRKPAMARRWAWLGRRKALTHRDADEMLRALQAGRAVSHTSSNDSFN